MVYEPYPAQNYKISINLNRYSLYTVLSNVFIMSKIRTKEQILDRNGFDFEAFKFENEYSAKNLLLAMDEYSEQNCDVIYNLFNRPAQKLKPLEDLYRKENPRPDSNFYIPDRTKFYEWITRKVLGS